VKQNGEISRLSSQENSIKGTTISGTCSVVEANSGTHAVPVHRTEGAAPWAPN
jgi:hypothetical protein